MQMLGSVSAAQLGVAQQKASVFRKMEAQPTPLAKQATTNTSSQKVMMVHNLVQQQSSVRKSSRLETLNVSYSITTHPIVVLKVSQTRGKEMPVLQPGASAGTTLP